MILLAIGCLLSAWLHTPITKMPTSMAAEQLKADFIRTDLTEEESGQVDFYFRWIRFNQAVSYSAFEFAQGGLAVLSVAVVVQNIYLIRRRKKNDPSA